MRLISIILWSLAFCVLMLGHAAGAAERIAPLAVPPLGERWFSITMGDERTGFAHTVTGAASGGYEVTSDSGTKMVVLGFSRESTSRESYLVDRDLSLHSFVVEQVIGGKRQAVRGEAGPKGVTITVEEGGKRRVKTLKTHGKVFVAPLLNLYPLMQGFVPGKKYRLQMVDPEELKLKQVTFTAVGREMLPGGVVSLHLRNNLYPFVDNDIWVDLKGNTIRESIRDGLVVTTAESESSARQFLLAAALANKEVVEDFTCVRLPKPIDRPAQVQRLAVELSALPPNTPLLLSPTQKVVRLDEGRALFSLEKGQPAGRGQTMEDSPQSTEELSPSIAELIALKDKIIGDAKDPATVIEKLAQWVAATVKESSEDDLPPLEAARGKKGNCPSQVRLYATLARSAGVPTRIVSGLAYAGGKGFVYQSWAESRIGDWVAVDPCFGQVPADATHIKFLEGETPAERAPLAEMIGRVKAKVVEEVY